MMQGRQGDPFEFSAAEKREATGQGRPEGQRLRDITIAEVTHPTALAGLHALEFHEAGTNHSVTVHLDNDGLALLAARLDIYERKRMHEMRGTS